MSGTTIGFNALPPGIRNSKVLSGDNLQQLAAVNELPVVDISFTDEMLKNIFQYYSITPDEMEKELHAYAAQLLNENKVYEAWQVLLAGENI